VVRSTTPRKFKKPVKCIVKRVQLVGEIAAVCVWFSWDHYKWLLYSRKTIRFPGSCVFLLDFKRLPSPARSTKYANMLCPIVDRTTVQCKTCTIALCITLCDTRLIRWQPVEQRSRCELIYESEFGSSIRRQLSSHLQFEEHVHCQVHCVSCYRTGNSNISLNTNRELWRINSSAAGLPLPW